MKITISDRGPECPHCRHINAIPVPYTFDKIYKCEKCEKHFKLDIVNKVQYIGSEIKNGLYT